MSDCDDIGQLIRHKYAVVEVVEVADTRGEAVGLFICSCPENAECRERLTSLSKAGHVVDQIVHFEARERAKECLHCQAARQLYPAALDVRADPVNVDTDGSTVDRLQDAPLMWAVRSALGTYGIVRKLQKCKCLTCNRPICDHTSSLKYVAERDGFDDQLVCRAGDGDENAAPVTSVSSRPIAFPPKQMTDPNTIGDVLVEPLGTSDGTTTCTHGNRWSIDNPLDHGWLHSKRNNDFLFSQYLINFLITGATLYYRSFFGIVAKPVSVAYRKTVLSTCNCLLEYDGGQHGILNLSNVTLIHHGERLVFLFSYIINS
jgi:hypothetical protein